MTHACSIPRGSTLGVAGYVHPRQLESHVGLHDCLRSLVPDSEGQSMKHDSSLSLALMLFLGWELAGALVIWYALV